MKLKHFLSREFRVLATFVGMIIGAGIFGVPYVIAQSGVVMALVWFVILGIVLYLAQIYFGRMTLAIPGHHRFPGFAGILLGKKGKDFAGFLSILSSWATLVVYIIIGGTFLHELLFGFFGGSLFIYQCIFALSSLLVVHGGLKTVGKSEGLMTTILIVVFLVIAGIIFPSVSVSNFTFLNINQAFLPYGVILFAISGLNVIPEIKDLLGREEAQKHLFKIIGVGTLISIIVTILFGLIVVGVTGNSTTPDAIAGLGAILGNKIVYLGALFGIFAIITSFFPVLMNLQETFSFDFKLSNVWSWLLSIGVPILFFVVGSRNFIQMLGLTGGVFGGLIDAFLIFVYIAFLKREKKPRLYFVMPIIIILFFVIGALNELFGFFSL